MPWMRRSTCGAFRSVVFPTFSVIAAAAAEDRPAALLKAENPPQPAAAAVLPASSIFTGRATSHPSPLGLFAPLGCRRRVTAAGIRSGAPELEDTVPVRFLERDWDEGTRRQIKI